MLVVLLIGRGVGDDNEANISIPCESATTAKLLKGFYADRGWRNLHITGWMSIQTYDQVKADIKEFDEVVDPRLSNGSAIA